MPIAEQCYSRFETISGIQVVAKGKRNLNGGRKECTVVLDTGKWLQSAVSLKHCIVRKLNALNCDKQKQGRKAVVTDIEKESEI